MYPPRGPNRDRGPQCPDCNGAMQRIPRTLFDRLVSLISPRKRYRCLSLSCGWEGTVRSAAAAAASPIPGDAGKH